VKLAEEKAIIVHRYSNKECLLYTVFKIQVLVNNYMTCFVRFWNVISFIEGRTYATNIIKVIANKSIGFKGELMSYIMRNFIYLPGI